MTDSYRRFAGLAAVATATAGVVFTVTFAIAVRDGDRWALWASSIALAFLVFGWLIVRGTDIPRYVGRLALLAAVLLLIVYFGRLIVLNPKRPVIKWVAVVSGLVANPAFYLAYGRFLLTRARHGTAVVVETRTPQDARR